jgi:hypothetical protein
MTMELQTASVYSEQNILTGKSFLGGEVIKAGMSFRNQLLRDILDAGHIS